MPIPVESACAGPPCPGDCARWYEALRPIERSDLLPDAFCERPPAWVLAIRTVLGDRDVGGQRPGDRFPLSAAVAPFVNTALGAVLQSVSATIGGRAAIRGDLTAILPTDIEERLIGLAYRTLVLELNILRLEGGLQGGTSEARFADFVRQVSAPTGRSHWLGAYPPLARLMAGEVERWVRDVATVVRDLVGDRAALEREGLLSQADGVIAAIGRPLGDFHHGGRSVRRITFESGHSLIYKPRSHAVDAAFYALLRWLNGRAPELLPFRTLGVLDCRDHGWTECVAVGPCASPEAVARYFQRQGQFLSLLHVLAATDIHFENVIACGEHPVIVDLETLFQPEWASQSGSDGDAPINEAISRVGLLPYPTRGCGAAVVDYSGLGTPPGQSHALEAMMMCDVASDTMHVEARTTAVQEGTHLPRLNGAQVPVFGYIAEVEGGFASMNGALQRLETSLTAPSGPLACFSGVAVRVVLRRTATYRACIDASLHPDVLRNAANRERCFLAVADTHAVVPHGDDVRACEVEAMAIGDVPYFAVASTGEAVSGPLAGLVGTPGMSVCLSRIAAVGGEGAHRQQWLIRASVATLDGAEELARGTPPARRWSPLASPDPLQLARQVGERLGELRIDRGSETTWRGLCLVEQTRWAIGTLGDDLYNGVPGVALFLAYLGEITAEHRWTAMAERALSGVLARLPQRSPTSSIGAFDGWGGLIYVLTLAGSLWGSRRLLDEARAIGHRVAASVEHDEQLDIMGGTAGLLAVTLAAYEITGDPGCLALAERCGQRLVATAVPQKEGVGWTTATAPIALAGVSHGAAGFAWVLRRLANVSATADWAGAAAENAHRYERLLYSATERNWQDLRSVEGWTTPRSMVAWCHGAPGIGLARIPFASPDALADIRVAAATTMSIGLSNRSHCLCHGDLGNLECLRLIQQATGILDEAQLQRATLAILGDLATRGPRSAVPASADHPGFMTGLAGIGYGLLRIAHPERVPSVLNLEGAASGQRLERHAT